jgi:hypothetical protein
MTAFRTSAGTPSHRIENDYGRGGDAKNALKRVVRKHRKWASAFNHALRDQCDEVLVQIDLMDPYSLPVREPRRWELTDDYSGTTLVVELTRMTS